MPGWCGVGFLGIVRYRRPLPGRILLTHEAMFIGGVSGESSVPKRCSSGSSRTPMDGCVPTSLRRQQACSPPV